MWEWMGHCFERQWHRRGFAFGVTAKASWCLVDVFGVKLSKM
jgi:hypothetical protein